MQAKIASLIFRVDSHTFDLSLICFIASCIWSLDASAGSLRSVSFPITAAMAPMSSLVIFVFKIRAESECRFSANKRRSLGFISALIFKNEPGFMWAAMHFLFSMLISAPISSLLFSGKLLAIIIKLSREISLS